LPKAALSACISDNSVNRAIQKRCSFRRQYKKKQFLPVSSSGHLSVAQHFMNIGENTLITSVVLHLGTLLAVFIAFFPTGNYDHKHHTSVCVHILPRKFTCENILYSKEKFPKGTKENGLHKHNHSGHYTGTYGVSSRFKLRPSVLWAYARNDCCLKRLYLRVFQITL